MRTIVLCLVIACLFAPAGGDEPRAQFKDFAGHISVLVILGAECPVSNGYAPELERLHERYKARDVVFYGVYCEPDVSLEKATKHADEYGMTFRRLLDHDQRLAQAAGVRIMPTAVVLGGEGQVLYRGRIDNRYSEKGQRRPEATTHDLDDAIKAVLDGNQPTLATTEPFGCPLPKLR